MDIDKWLNNSQKLLQEFNQVWYLPLVIFSVLGSGFLVFFTYFRDLFIQIETLKLIIISISFIFPILLLNIIIIRSNPLFVNIFSEVKNIKQRVDFQIYQIKKIKLDENHQIDEETCRTSLEECEDIRSEAKFIDANLLRTNIFFGALNTTVAIYVPLINHYNDEFKNFLISVGMIELFFAGIYLLILRIKLLERFTYFQTIAVVVWALILVEIWKRF